MINDLPREGVNQSFPFSRTGVDNCGPLLVKFKKQRKSVLNKIYVIVCVCLYIKAIHFYFVSDFTIEAFITSLKCFFGRSGKCAKIM